MVGTSGAFPPEAFSGGGDARRLAFGYPAGAFVVTMKEKF